MYSKYRILTSRDTILFAAERRLILNDERSGKSTGPYQQRMVRDPKPES